MPRVKKGQKVFDVCGNCRRELERESRAFDHRLGEGKLADVASHPSYDEKYQTCVTCGGILIQERDG